MASTNTYGIVRPTLISADDADIFYSYAPTRSATPSAFVKVADVSSMLTSADADTAPTDDYRLPGMYRLSLPVSIFGNSGIYTIYIRPKEFTCTIKDVGVLSAYPDIRGIVIDSAAVGDYASLLPSDGLTGYRVEYYALENGVLRRQQYYRLVTSSNMCEPVTQSLTSSNANSNGYRYNASGTLAFLTLTPSTSPSFKPNATPYIGVPSQTVTFSNTKFDPICLEVEVTDHDIETLSFMLEGDQVRNLENGRVTTYNFDGEVYRQAEYSTIKDSYTGRAVAEIKVDTTDDLDTSLDLDTLKNS